MKVSFITGPGQGTEFVRTLKALEQSRFKPPGNRRGVEELDGDNVMKEVGKLLKDPDQSVVLDEDTPNAVKVLGQTGQNESDRLILVQRMSGNFNLVNPDTNQGGITAFQYGVWRLQKEGLLPKLEGGSFVYQLHPGHGKENDKAAAQYIKDGLDFLNVVIVDGQGNQDALKQLEGGHPRLFIVFNRYPFHRPRFTQDLDEAIRKWRPGKLVTGKMRQAILKEWEKAESSAA